MRVYADTSFLISLYGADTHSPAARARVDRIGVPLPYSDLQRFELENAVRLLCFRRIYSPQQSRAMLAALQQDQAAGYLPAITLDWPDVLARAHAASAQHTFAGGHRAMDILHVAAAASLGAALFLSFDVRQQALARVQGLDVD
jgi:predicted nucleic acid-binding protein